MLEAWERICNQINFNVYEFPPPDMAEGCEKFIAEYEDEIVDGLVSRKDNDSVEHSVCFRATKVRIRNCSV